MAEDIRAFVAVLISKDLKRKIAVVQEEFKKAAPDVKWVEEENFHVTMKFLGNVKSDKIRGITEAVAGAVQDLQPFDIEMAGAGAFPNAKRPRVVWAGISSGVEQLAEVAKRVEDVLEPLGFPKEDRPFRAHITIGRVKDDRGTGRLTGALLDSDVGQLGTVQVGSVALMKSELRREGPIYSVLAEMTLLGTGGGEVTDG